MKNNTGFFNIEKALMVTLFGLDFQLKKRVVINLKLMRRNTI